MGPDGVGLVLELGGGVVDHGHGHLEELLLGADMVATGGIGISVVMME